jgi:hypothetical protein
VNVEGTKHVVAACLAAGRGWFIAARTTPGEASLGEPSTNEAAGSAGAVRYHRAKAVAELVLDAVANGGLEAVICSPGTLLGPHDYQPSMIAAALIDLYRGRLPVLMQVVSDFVDTRDVAAGMIAAAERGRSGERYLLSGDVLTMQDVTREVASITGRRMPRVFLPIWVGWALLPFSLAAARLTRKQPLFTAGVLRASVSNRVVIHEKASRSSVFLHARARPRSRTRSPGIARGAGSKNPRSRRPARFAGARRLRPAGAVPRAPRGGDRSRRAGDQLVGAPDRERGAGQPHRLLEEEVRAELRAQTRSLQAAREIARYPAEQHLDAALAHPLEETLELGDADGVGVARPLDPQHHDHGARRHALLDPGEMLLERRRRSKDISPSSRRSGSARRPRPPAGARARRLRARSRTR